MMLSWDVLNGVCFGNVILCISMMMMSLPMQVCRRTWSGHPLAKETLCEAMATQPKLNVTVPYDVTDHSLLDQVFQN